MLSEKTLKLFQTLKSDRRVVWLLTLVLVFLLGRALWQTVNIFLPASTPTITQPQRQPLAKLPDVASLHLFGNYQAIRASLLPKAQLQVKLLGIFYSKMPRHSQALIGGPGIPAKLYSAGQTLPGGAIIDEILPESVIIRLDGNLQALVLPRPALKFLPKPSNTL